MTLVLTRTRIEEKATWATEQLAELRGGRDQSAEFDAHLLRFDHPDALTRSAAWSNATVLAHTRPTIWRLSPVSTTLTAFAGC